MEDVILTNDEAMAFFKITNVKVWQKFQRDNKIPFFFAGRQKRYYRDALVARTKSICESTAKKVYVKKETSNATL